MEQAIGVADLVETLHAVRPSLSIGLFSGYSEHELEQGRFRCELECEFSDKCALWERVRSQLDFAVLGRYNRQQPAADPLITSRNQRLRFYSNRYTLADFAPQSVEVTIDASGLTQSTGFPVLGSLFG
jgi:hypothetical protein